MFRWIPSTLRRRHHARQTRRAPLVLEPLEDRCVPAVLTNFDGNIGTADPGTHTVRAQIIDKDGDSTERSTVSAVSADSHFGSPNGIDVSGVRGQSLEGFVATFTPAAGDVPEDFAALILWGDGTNSEVGVGFIDDVTFGVFGQHVYAAEEVFDISVVIGHRDNSGVEISSRAVVTVTSLDETTGLLLVGGTPGNDTIVIIPADTTGGVQVSINGDVQGPFQAGSIAAYGYDGNDTLAVGTLTVGTVIKVKVPTLLHGGAGNDVLDARLNKGSTMLVGSAGNDTLTGSNVRDILIGGLGSDILKGRGGENILVADPFVADQFVAEDDRDISFQLLGHWARTDLKFKLRKADFEQIFNEGTLASDGVLDQLSGGAVKDWFLLRTGQDVVTNRLPGDSVIDLF